MNCPKCKKPCIKLGALLGDTPLFGCPHCQGVYWGPE